MSSHKRITILTLVSAALCTSTSAQTLSEEVIIDREITPVERPVVRPGWVLPSMLSPKADVRKLSFNEFVDVAEITRSITPLGAVEWGDSVMRSPYRGYATLGYFPVFNLGASAGYRFIRTNKIDAGAHLSYEGSSWSGGDAAESDYTSNRFAIGADATATFAPGRLYADLGYVWSGTGTASYPGCYDRGKQGLNHVALDLKWEPAKTGRFGWNVAFGLGYGGFTSDKTAALPHLTNHVGFVFEPVKDFNLGVKSDLSYRIGSGSGILLGLGFDYRHTNNFNGLEAASFYSESLDSYYATAVPDEYGPQSMGIVTLRPAYRFFGGKVSARLGVRFDISTGGLNHSLHVAPDIDIEWAPSSMFAAYLRATGGEVMNTNVSLWERNPWMAGVFAVERSHVNADIELGLTFGSYKGFWATVHGGFSSVSNWAVPVVFEGVNTWSNVPTFSGFNFGVELGYSWKDMVRVVGHAAGAQHTKYYRWQDNARWAFDIAAKVRPLRPLQIELGYAVRVDRAGCVYTAVPQTDGSAYFLAEASHLGDTSNLFVGAEYELTPSFGIFLKAENLLNRHWAITDYIRSQGIHGLAGIQLKF